MNSHGRYLLLTVIFLFIVLLPFILNYALMVASGETMQLREIVAEQHRTGALYGTNMHDVRRELHLEIVRYRKPEIVVLGSSRALDFRQEFFTRPFACACQAMDNIDEGKDFVTAMLKIHGPKLVLFTLDFWWFTANRVKVRPLKLNNAVKMTQSKIFKPFKLLSSGFISPTDYFAILFGNRNLDAAVALPKIGLWAIKHSVATRADGSILHGIRLGEAGRRYYKGYSQPMNDAWNFVKKWGRYGPDKRLIPERLRAFDEIVSKLQRNGVRVIVILPPIAPPIPDAMVDSGRHTFINKLVQYLEHSGLEFYNFHHSKSIGADICEFSDSHHGSNVAYMRMLRKIITRNPASPLREYVDPGWLDRQIRKYSGRTIATFNPEIYLKREIDFLDMNCAR